MGVCRLNEREYYQKIYGGWLGKNIGGTLGAPVEGKMERLHLDYFPELAEGPLPNDDLDLQLVWLHALEQYGARLTAEDLGKEWMEHVFFPYDEYGYALANLRRGLKPPVSGWFNNPFIHCMGAPIRSEIWAMIAPGCPGVASYYAYQDAIVDHAGGEGVYGEMFFAAIESAAFFEKDRDTLIALGLRYIPEHCRTSLAVRDLLRWHREGKDWTEARALILERHGSPNFTDAPQNVAFTILGWLYGEDFGDALLKAVNCGYDTDCTGATLGAILGILYGSEHIPERWLKPVGDRIAVNKQIKGFSVPQSLGELSARTIRVAKEVAAVWEIPIQIGDIPTTEWTQEIRDYYDPRWLWKESVHQNRYFLPQGTKQNLGMELIVDYGMQGPSIGRNQTKSITFKLLNRSREEWTGELRLTVPVDWEGSERQSFVLSPGQELQWEATFRSSERIEPTNPLIVEIVRMHDGHCWNSEKLEIYLVASTHWTVRGPKDEQGISAVFPGNRIDFGAVLNTDEAGVYTASTTLVNPSARDFRLIAATDRPVKVYLNGKLIINAAEITDFIPAFHRSAPSKTAEFRLPEGRHELTVEVVKGSSPIDLFILPVAQYHTKTPGQHYFFIDAMFV